MRPKIKKPRRCSSICNIKETHAVYYNLVEGFDYWGRDNGGIDVKGINRIFYELEKFCN